MAGFNNIKIEWETRLCRVGDRIGYFHTWEQFSLPVAASLLQGGPPAGVISEVFAIVEFETGVEKVHAYNINFCDEIHSDLVVMNKYFEEEKGKENV